MMTAAPPTSPSSSPMAEKMKSVSTNGMRPGIPLADADTGHRSRSQREERLHELVALPGGVGERVEPDRDPLSARART